MVRNTPLFGTGCRGGTQPDRITTVTKLFAAPVKQSAVEFLPFDPPGKKLG
ncbi:hypothetical protein RAZWK3B_07484 [Roseobacter sp. AzwK-3b]|uniref:hypothetical protein n=1 Tax=Roseobacter sp. AzwK-3b TaxID=351016 RepID=UPI000156A503|nr:hypothetical protein [Roseobacter sp. AzwK-3b]EDM70072.1 hypothetical protein RAZWK3B_07484 [Roseobacter sp. AzwK-3b]